MSVNDIKTFNFNIIPETATNKNLIWESDDNMVASIIGNGTVKGLNSGLAKIKVESADGNAENTFNLHVNDVITEE